MVRPFLQGLAPFGADIAVLAYNTGFEGASPRLPNNMAASAAAAAAATGSATAAEGISAVLIHERPELKILTWAKEEVASDALLITGGLQAVSPPTAYTCVVFKRLFSHCVHALTLQQAFEQVTREALQDLFLSLYIL